MSATLLPSTLLQTATNHRLLVEMKSGDTYFGLLVKIDSKMNIHLRDAMCQLVNVTADSSKDGSVVRMADVFIRGNSIKGFCLPEEVGDAAQVPENQPHPRAKGHGKKGKGKGESAGPAGRGGNRSRPDGTGDRGAHKVQRTGGGGGKGGKR